jgi:hypothetical protein
MRFEVIKKICFLLITSMLFFSCQKESKGEALAKLQCASCHQFPEPSLLDQTTWQTSVLPKMAIRMGVRPLIDLQEELNYDEIIAIKEANIIPEKPLVSADDWNEIVNYYIANSSEKLATITSSKYEDLRHFQVKNIDTYSKGNITLLKYDEARSQLFVGDRQSGLFVFDKNFRQLSSNSLTSPASAINFNQDGSIQLTLMGQMDPTSLPTGSLMTGILDKKNAFNFTKNSLEKLIRPVFVSKADFNQDGQDDWLISNFGHYLGSLAWYEKSGKIHPLKALPGALQTFVRDLNGDKLPDIIALMAQGNEGIFSFINQGKGEFVEKQVLQFPSIYGSSSIDLIDFDGDGDEDILYANGDNGDYSRITKPYHGIRIFLNNGKNEFQEKYFFQMNGATKAIAKDFDNDGDLDIAAIAFFADFSQKPQNSFVMLENKGKLNFVPKSSNLFEKGRWLTMEAADFDKDGDQDILLGSCVDVPLKAPQEIKIEWKKANSKLLLLENTIK